MITLSKKQIIMLHSQLISETGGTDGIRDEGLLDSAISAPFQWDCWILLYLLHSSHLQALKFTHLFNRKRHDSDMVLLKITLLSMAINGSVHMQC